MHRVIGVIHREKVFNEEYYLDKFLYNNDNYYEMQEEIDAETLQRLINDDIEEYRSREANLLDERRMEYLTMVTNEQDPYVRAHLYADYYEYDGVSEDGGVGYYSNPYGEFDYYVVGGRWNNMLYDFEGNCGNTMKLSDINFNNENGIKSLCGILDGEHTEYYINWEYQDEDAPLRLILDPYISETTDADKDLYLTIVDGHY